MLTSLFSGAEESIYILDWWLSPELYLRRPPSRNEQYRLDAMLQAAAERGVQINVIVYKEVEAALTLDSAVCNSINSLHHPDRSLVAHSHMFSTPNTLLRSFTQTSKFSDILIMFLPDTICLQKSATPSKT